jgi:hypothetical protein
MNEDSYYENCFQKHLDTSFDGHFETMRGTGLTWLPWVGKEYNTGKVLIVGESHYTAELALADASNKKFRTIENPRYTREIVAEYPIYFDWGRHNPTFDNINRAILRTALVNQNEMAMRGRLWDQLAFYNFVQRPMDYGAGRRERPQTVEDYYAGWPVFIELIKTIQPRTCIFIGVEALNTFNWAMKDLGVQHTPIEWGDFINRVYTRNGGSVTINNITTRIICIKHTSQFFSWERWNEYLAKTVPEMMAYLKQTVFGGEPVNYSEQANPVLSEDDRKYTKKIPTWLSHKPIYACKYGVALGKDDEDAQFLSVGRAQYDQGCAAVKVFRHSGNRWSRQSEEIPISRLGYMMQIFLSAIRVLQAEGPPKQTSLCEEIISPEEMTFLRSQFHENQDEIIHSLKEIKELLNDIDLNKI